MKSEKEIEQAIKGFKKTIEIHDITCISDFVFIERLEAEISSLEWVLNKEKKKKCI